MMAGDPTIEPELFAAARIVQDNAHVPYSRFPVGAALRTPSGSVFVGCNVENAAYPEGTCAEAGAIAAMVAAGERQIEALVTVCEGEALGTCCGGCRQKIREFATDGTMADYCDVLRTQGDDSTMDIEIYRPSLDLVLEGQVNGDPIELPLITGAVVGDGDGQAPVDAPITGDAPYEYTTVQDDQGLISVSIPTAWSDVDGTPNPNFGPSIWASPDIQGYLDTWDVPGIIVESAPDRSADEIDALLLERDLSDICEDFGAEPYEDPLYFGTLQVYGNCGGTGTYYIILAAAPYDADYLVRVEVQAVQPRDLEAADEALATFIANI